MKTHQSESGDTKTYLGLCSLVRPHVNTERRYLGTTATAGMECGRMYFDLHRNSCRYLHEGFLLLLQKRVVSRIKLDTL